MLYNLGHCKAGANAVATLHCLKRLRREWFLSPNSLPCDLGVGFKAARALI